MRMVEYELTGYAGWSDYDGPIDNNLGVQKVVYPSSMSEKEIYDLLFKRYGKNHRCVTLHLKKVRIFDV